MISVLMQTFATKKKKKNPLLISYEYYICFVSTIVLLSRDASRLAPNMTAFVPTISTGSFVNRVSPHTEWRAAKCATAPSMTANWPDDNGPAYSKYLSNIPLDRLNKAPVIVINSYANQDHNSVSVRMADLRADEGAGETLRSAAIGIVNENEEAGPPEWKWAPFYDPATVNQAPVISMAGGDTLPARLHHLCIIQREVPTSIAKGRAILDGPYPDPAAFALRFEGRLNMAPAVQIDAAAVGDEAAVSVETAFYGLNLVAANEILSKFRS